MDFWITGVAGFIGQAVARNLSASGTAFAGIGPHSDAPLLPAIGKRLISEKITTETLAQLHARFGAPSAVIHAAGSGSVSFSLADPAADFESNVQTIQILCEYLRNHSPRTKLVLISSAAIYGAKHTGPISESVTPLPISPYGFNKLAAELVVRSYAGNFGLASSIVRLFSVYGEGLQKQVLWDLCNRLRSAPKVELSGTGNEQRDFIYVDDAARLLVRSASLAAEDAPTLNGGSGQATTMSHLAELITNAWKQCTGQDRTISFNGIVRPGDPAHLVSDMTRAAKLGHQTQIRLEDGIRRYVRWFTQLDEKGK